MTIENSKRYYYEALERNNKETEITDWLIYFAELTLEAQSWSQSYIDLLIRKTRMFDQLRGQINERQSEFLNHVFSFGPNAEKQEITADMYINVTNTSRATATRDLQDLVEKHALSRTGERKATRYFLNIATRLQ